MAYIEGHHAPNLTLIRFRICFSSGGVGVTIQLKGLGFRNPGEPLMPPMPMGNWRRPPLWVTIEILGGSPEPTNPEAGLPSEGGGSN